MFEKEYKLAIEKIRRNSEKIGATFPHVGIGANGEFNNEPIHFWTNGFWGGLLWLAYRETHDSKLLEIAYDIEEKLDEPLNDFIHMHHDVGFIWIPTALQHYLNTGSEKSRVRALKAASILAGRFNPKGNYIRAWNEDILKNSAGIVIIDCMMNIPLLYWASKETGDPRFKHIAMSHADTVLNKVIRPDNTVPHLVRFNENTGEKIECLGGQGKDANSVWSRGQAWAIYGMAISYRETGKKEYFDAAKAIAKKYMSSLPDNKIPYWDFCSDEKDKFAKDSSSASCTASGLLEIASLCDDEKEKQLYTDYAIELIDALIKECACFDDSIQGILKNGTVSYPNNKHVNVPIIYGDFYFIEALDKLKGLKGFF